MRVSYSQVAEGALKPQSSSSTSHMTELGILEGGDQKLDQSIFSFFNEHVWAYLQILTKMAVMPFWKTVGIGIL